MIDKLEEFCLKILRKIKLGKFIVMIFQEFRGFMKEKSRNLMNIFLLPPRKKLRQVFFSVESLSDVSFIILSSILCVVWELFVDLDFAFCNEFALFVYSAFSIANCSAIIISSSQIPIRIPSNSFSFHPPVNQFLWPILPIIVPKLK